MKMLLNVRIPHEPFNTSVKDGTAGQKLNQILEAIKPEAVYFTEQDGLRGAILVVDLTDPAMIPALAEPWFLTFQAEVELRIVMTPDVLKRAGLTNSAKNGVDWHSPFTKTIRLTRRQSQRRDRSRLVLPYCLSN
jgi:hypothetical protein